MTLAHAVALSEPSLTLPPRPVGPRVMRDVWEPVRGWLFELDGTLYERTLEERAALKAAARAAAARAGLDVRVAAGVAESVASHARGLAAVDEILRTLAMDESHREFALRIMEERRPRPRPFPGVCDLLHLLHEEHRVGVIVRPPDEDRWDGLELAAFLDVAVHVGSPRDADADQDDATGLFVRAARRLGLRPAQVAYVGSSSPSRFRAARLAGLATVRVVRRDSRGVLSPGPEVDAVLDDLRAIVALLPSIGVH